MKRILGAALIAAMLLSVFAGCGKEASDDAQIYGEETEKSLQSSDDSVKVSFFGFKADAVNLTAIENAIHAFVEVNPGIEIAYEGLKGTQYGEAFEIRLENDNLDDIFMVHHDDVLRLAPEGKLADLSELSTIDGFSEMAKTQFTEADGSIYFLPTAISTYAMYVNLDLLKENNLEVPTNWSEFSEQCDYFKSKGITPIIGNNYGSLRFLMSARSLYPVYQMDNSAEMIEAFNSGEEDIMEYLEDGVRMVGTMLEKGWFDKEEVLNTGQTSDDLALFAEGERPFMITGGWASQRLMDMGPKCSYAIYPYPILEDGSVLVMNVDTCISVNKESENLEEAKLFVEYLTQPDVIYEYCDTQSCYTPLEDDRAPSDETISPMREYLFNGECIIGSDYRLKLPLDNSEDIVAEEMLKGMNTEDAIKLLGELIRQ